MATTTTDLGKIMLTNGGEYDPETTYDAKTFVLYNGSTYVALKTNVGIEPVDDRVNWQLMARGFMGEEVDIQGYVYVESEEDEEEETVPEPMLDADALGGSPPGYYGTKSDISDVLSDISDSFSETKDYLKGDYCIKDNKLYKFTEDKETGAWDGSVVVPVSVAEELRDTQSDISQLNSVMSYGPAAFSAIIPNTTVIGSYTRGWKIGLIGYMYVTFKNDVEIPAWSEIINTPFDVKKESFTLTDTGYIVYAEGNEKNVVTITTALPPGTHRFGLIVPLC